MVFIFGGFVKNLNNINEAVFLLCSHSASDADFGSERPTRRAALSVRSDLLILSPVYLSAKNCLCRMFRLDWILCVHYTRVSTKR